MKIQRLFLRNVRSIKSLDLDFHDPVTGKPMSRIVLAGANGSGKTTILESIWGLISSLEKYGNGGLSTHSQLENINFKVSPDAELQIDFEVDPVLTSIGTLSVYYGVASSISDDPSITEKAHVGGMRGEWLGGTWGISEESYFRQISETIRIQRELQGDGPIRDLGTLIFFPHDRHLPYVKQGELAVEINPYELIHRYVSSDEWKQSVESYLFSLNYLDLEDRDRKVSASRFKDAVMLVNSVLVGKKIMRIQKGRVIIETEQGESHGLGDLSSGEKQLTLLLIEIHRRISRGSVILIDEPEISLHPAWQRGLVVALDKIIEQYNAQVIMATHSPEIAGMVLPHEVIFLSDLNLPLGEWIPEQEALA